MRTCPKCGDVWGQSCDYCCTCGAPLVNRSAMRRSERTPVVTKGRRRRNCIYCGGTCYTLTCVSHRDLLALDPVFRR